MKMQVNWTGAQRDKCHNFQPDQVELFIKCNVQIITYVVFFHMIKGKCL
jgi:hypothetical protein